jgi:hypothetical protein
MADAWRHWRPVSAGGAEQQAMLINEVMKTLSVYGYGALPSDPMQSKAKVEGFCEVLEDVPIWAIEEAGKEWRKKESDFFILLTNTLSARPMFSPFLSKQLNENKIECFDYVWKN